MRVDAAAGRNLAVGLGDLALHVLELRDAQGKRKRHIDISRNERQHRRRWILDNRVVDAVEIRQPRFPVTRVARDPDRLVLLELDEFERSEEHTSELQSLRHLVCRLLLEKKKKKELT